MSCKCKKCGHETEKKLRKCPKCGSEIWAEMSNKIDEIYRDKSRVGKKG